MDWSKRGEAACGEAELADGALGLEVARAASTARKAAALLDWAAAAGLVALVLFLGALVLLWVAAGRAATYLAALPPWPGWQDRAQAYAAGRRAEDDPPAADEL